MSVVAKTFCVAFLVLAWSGIVEAETLRLPVTRDTWFSNVGSEADGNNGGAPKLKLKSYQEMSLVDIDPAPLRGHVVLAATLSLKLAAEPILKRVTVGTFGSEWFEGTGAGYALEAGSSTFNHRRHPDLAWASGGGDLCHVILGQGGTTWRMADASAPDAERWQHVAVDPLIVALRVAGVSHGFFLFDDTGSEWTRQGETFQRIHMPNRFVCSRESGTHSAPYLSVTLRARDDAPPTTPEELMSDTAGLPAGEAYVSWLTPRDQGEAGTVGFLVRIDDKDVLRNVIPLAGKAGERVSMHLRDMGLAAGSRHRVSVRGVDGAGNVGAEATTEVRVSPRGETRLPGTSLSSFSSRGTLPRLRDVEVAVLDELDKVLPDGKTTIPSQSEGYLRGNHLWDAQARRIRLHAARNEFVGFQLLFRGPLRRLRATLTFPSLRDSQFRVEWGRYQRVSSKKGVLPDPVVPVPFPVDLSTEREGCASLYAELYLPHSAPSGKHAGTLTLEAEGGWLTLEVALTIWDFTLSDVLSFLPEMNCYGLPDNEREYYRLAHRHRVVLNRVPYSQRGIVHEGCAPKWNGRDLEWEKWDRRFGPYFDGSAFADLPRQGVPIECFYLPIHENWPDPIEDHYNGDFWADRAFTASYRRDLVEVSRQFAAHLHARGWQNTLFQFFLNGKNDFKQAGWSRGSSPWLLDEPANFQDFWALRYFGAAFHEGLLKAPGSATLVFRGDISRPQWQRDALDGLLDYNVVGSAMRPYHRIVFDRKATEGQVVLEYGSTNAIEDSNVQPAGWCLDSWSLGSDGVVPWQTIGTADSWKKADELALFYPAPAGAETGPPIPSMRLKAYRRGQQDVEYLTLFSQISDEPRWAIGQKLRQELRLQGQRQASGFTGGEDAGLIQFHALKPQDLWSLRVRIGQAVSAAHPVPKRRLVELWPRARTLGDLRQGKHWLVGTPAGAVAAP